MDEEKQDIEAAIQYAKKYLEDLLSFFGLNTEVYATREDDVIELNVPSSQMNGFLIGQRGDTVRALQFVTSSALKNNGYAYSRVNVDVADYKKQRADRLAKTAEDWVKQVRDTGELMHLKPMNAADRRTIHKLASEHGVETASEGEGFDRHVVLRPGESKPGSPESGSEDSREVELAEEKPAGKTQKKPKSDKSAASKSETPNTTNEPA